MYTKTITPESTSVTIDLPESFVGEHVRVIAVIERRPKRPRAKSLEEIRDIYSKFPKADLSKFKFDRDEANDFD